MASQAPGEIVFFQLRPLDEGINVNWGAAARRGSDVVDYVIQWKLSTETVDDANQVNADKIDGEVIFFTNIESLVNGVSYDVRVWGVDAIGRNGVPTRWQSAIPVGPIGVPQNVTLTAGNGTISVAWQPPPASAGDTPTGYTVEWKRSTDADTAMAECDRRNLTSRNIRAGERRYLQCARVCRCAP